MSVSSSISEVDHVSRNNLSRNVCSGVERNRVRHQMPSIDIKRFSLVDTVTDDSSIHLNTEILNKHRYRAGHVVSANEAASLNSDFRHSTPPITPRSDSVVTGGGVCDDQKNAVDVSAVSNLYRLQGSSFPKSVDRNKDIENRVSTLVEKPHLLNPLPSEEKYPTTQVFATEKRIYSSKKTHLKQVDYLAELYYRGVKKRREIEKQREAVFSDRIKEFERLPFHPEITQKAKSIRRCGSVPACYEADRQLRQRLLLQSWKSEETKECRTTPQISKGSERIVRHARGNSVPLVSVEERLYLDAARRRLVEEEEEEKYMNAKKTLVIKRSHEELEAHVASLYTYEAKRLKTLEKLREEEENRNLPLRLCTKAVTRRLLHSSRRVRRRGCLAEDVATFEPNLNPKTNELRLRARKRRMQQWYLFLSTPDQEKKNLDSTAKKIQSVLNEAKLSDNYTLDEFCSTLDRYEEAHGKQHWLSAAPPSENYANAELTFAPRVNYRSESLLRQKEPNELSLPAHKRLFETARKKQILQKEQELKEHEAALAGEEMRIKKRRILLKHWGSNLRRKTENQNISSSEEASICHVLPPAAMCSSSGERLHPEEFVEGSEVSLSSSSSDLVRQSPPPPQQQQQQQQHQKPKQYYSRTTGSVSSDLMDAVGELRSLVDEDGNQTNEIAVLMDSLLPSSKDNYTSFANADIAHHHDPVEVTIMPSRRNTLQKKRSARHLRNRQCERGMIPLFTDVALECALSRPTWPADVERRHQEWRESRHRLRCVGQTLYEKMHSQLY